MADYAPLLIKALDAQTDHGSDARRSVYDRARSALATQLRVIEPKLSEADILRETQSLDDAIARVDKQYRGADEPVEGTVVARPERARPPAPRIADRPAIRTGQSRRQAVLVVAVLTTLAVPIGWLAWTWRGQPPRFNPPTEPVQAQVSSGATADAAPKLGERLAGSRAAAPSTAASPAIVGPSRPPAAPDAAPSRSQPSVATATPAQSPPAQPAPAQVAPGQAPPAQAGPPPATELAVAQRAVLVEDGAGDQPGQKTTVGRAIWRLDSAPGGPGQPLETVLRCNVDVPEGGFSLALTLRRNTDAALPASHTVELTFTPAAGEAGRSVRDVGAPLMRPDEMSRGVPLAALPVPVKQNIFLIGLSDLGGDVDRNRELLLNRTWLEIPLRFTSGARAALLIDKGVSGARLLAEAFRIWSGAAP